MRACSPMAEFPRPHGGAPAQYLLASIPKPNAGESLFATSAEAQTIDDNKGALRLDWTHGAGTLTGYYFLDGYSLDNPYPDRNRRSERSRIKCNIERPRATCESAAYQHVRQIELCNEARLSFMRNSNAVGQAKGGDGPSLASQGFTGMVAPKPATEGIENVAFNDFTLGVDTTALEQAENIPDEVSDAFSRILGRHGLKFGGEMHVNQINTHPDVVFNGSFNFNGSETGLDFADFLLGTPSSYTQGQARDFYNRNLYMAAFVQDSWKATDRLTVNYGVRWDRIRPWEEKFNQLQTLIKGEQSQVFPGAPKGLVFPG